MSGFITDILRKSKLDKSLTKDIIKESTVLFAKIKISDTYGIYTKKSDKNPRTSSKDIIGDIIMFDIIDTKFISQKKYIWNGSVTKYMESTKATFFKTYLNTWNNIFFNLENLKKALSIYFNPKIFNINISKELVKSGKTKLIAMIDKYENIKEALNITYGLILNTTKKDIKSLVYLLIPFISKIAIRYIILALIKDTWYPIIKLNKIINKNFIFILVFLLKLCIKISITYI